MVNEFVAKKLGEVLAFAEVYQETLEKGKKGFLEIMDQKRLNVLKEQAQEQEKLINELASELNCKEITSKKALATGQKLRAMRDGYVGDAWDDAAELLEWSGFFLGAAVVHSQLVLGAGEKLRLFKMIALANHAIRFYDELLRETSRLIKINGTERA